MDVCCLGTPAVACKLIALIQMAFGILNCCLLYLPSIHELPHPVYQAVTGTIIMVSIMYILLSLALLLGTFRESRKLLVGYQLMNSLQIVVQFGLMLYMVNHRDKHKVMTTVALGLFIWITLNCCFWLIVTFHLRSITRDKFRKEKLEMNQLYEAPNELAEHEEEQDSKDGSSKVAESPPKGMRNSIEMEPDSELAR